MVAAPDDPTSPPGPCRAPPRLQCGRQLANFLAASHLRVGRLVPILLPHLSAHMGLHVYYGSRTAQPRRVRAFLDLVVARLTDAPEFVLSDRELSAALQGWRRAARPRR